MRTAAIKLLEIWLLAAAANEISRGLRGDDFVQEEYGLPKGATVACFGDLNGDQFIDLVAISNASQLHVYINHPAVRQYVLTSVVETSKALAGCIAADFNSDGLLDLLSMSEEANSIIRLTVYLALGREAVFNAANNVEVPSSKGQVTVLDANNDLWPDLYGLAADGTRAFWINAALPRLSFHIEEHHVPGFSSMSIPHSNAFVDLDGDCKADLFAVGLNPRSGARRFEVWINQSPWPSSNRTHAFGTEPARIIPVEKGFGQATFMDFDGDGSMDLLVPSCHPPGSCAQDNALTIFYNQQLQFCSTLSSAVPCRSIRDMCAPDPGFQLGSTVRVPAGRFGTSRFTPPPHRGPPLTIQTGDIDLDGYPDLLIPLTSTDSDGNVHRVLSVWISVPCVKEWCSAAAILEGRRTFQERASRAGPKAGHQLRAAAAEAMGVYAAAEDRGVYAGALLDLENDGTLDLITLSQNPQEAWPASRSALPTIFVNNMVIDAQFLVLLATNGVTLNRAAQGSRRKPFGAMAEGGSVKVVSTDINGCKRVQAGAQMPQSAYMALGIPGTHFGLGRSTQVNNLFVGVPLPANHTSHWKGIMPNSRLFVFPSRSDASGTWHILLFLSQGSLMSSVVLVWGGVLVVLGFIYVGASWYTRSKAKKKAVRARLYF